MDAIPRALESAPGARGRRIPQEGRQGETMSSIDSGPPRPPRDAPALASASLPTLSISGRMGTLSHQTARQASSLLEAGSFKVKI